MLFRGEVIALYDRDYHHDRTNYRLKHYSGLLEKRPGSVYHAAPIKETVPTDLYNFLVKLKSPKEIVKVLRLYFDMGNQLMKHLPFADSYDTLYACVAKASAPCELPMSERRIVLPNLHCYDSLLRGGESI